MSYDNTELLILRSKLSGLESAIDDLVQQLRDRDATIIEQQGEIAYLQGTIDASGHFPVEEASALRDALRELFDNWHFPSRLPPDMEEQVQGVLRENAQRAFEVFLSAEIFHGESRG